MWKRWFGKDENDESDGFVTEALRPLSFDGIPVPEPLPSEPIELKWSPSGSVKVDQDESLILELQSAAQAKLAVKELRLRKRELGVEKRQVNQEMAAIRRDYASKNAQRAPSVRGGGSVGRMLRTFDQVGRANDRARREEELAPLEEEKRTIDSAIHIIDDLIHECDEYIIRQKAAKDTNRASSPKRRTKTRIFCTSCGAVIESEYRFCGECGAGVKSGS